MLRSKEDWALCWSGIVSIVQEEIYQHKAGELEKFTPYEDIGRKCSISLVKVYEFIKQGIPKEDRQYIHRELILANRKEKEELRRENIEEKKRKKYEEKEKERYEERKYHSQIVNLVNGEIRQRKSGELDTFTSNSRLCDTYNISPFLLNKVLKKGILEDNRKYRKKEMASINNARRVISEESRKKMSEAKIGTKNPRYKGSKFNLDK